MARVTSGYSFGLTTKETLACRVLALGGSEEEAIRYLDVPENCTRGEHMKGMNRLHKLMRDPKFQECFRAIVAERTMAAYGHAVGKIIQQIDEDNGWLANKAANDVLTRFGPTIMGEDDKQVVIRVENGPVLGIPEE